MTFWKLRKRRVSNGCAKDFKKTERGQVVEEKLKKLSKVQLREVIMELANLLPQREQEQLNVLLMKAAADSHGSEKMRAAVRMSQELMDEKIAKIKTWARLIDEGELYLDVEEYEDYSSGYWDSDWITEYYDNQGIGDKLTFAIQFAKDCVDDRRYQEAESIYQWLWEMSVSADSEFDCDPVDLEALVDNHIVCEELRILALLTLYAAYQTREAGERAEELYSYFFHYPFRDLHMEDMFPMGREELPDAERFWKDWIALLRTKSGSVEGRLLKEALIYSQGVEGLVKLADESCDTHPSLYLAAMEEYSKKHDYEKMEEIGRRALENIDSKLIIRSKAALKAAYAASCLAHEEAAMDFCWESFRSHSTDENFLRLFATEKMALRYGARGMEVLAARLKGEPKNYLRNEELRQNIIGDFGFYTLSFYTGDFETAKAASKNPQGSLGWSARFIQYGVRLFLLYLYENPLPSKVASITAGNVGCSFLNDVKTDGNLSNMISFETRILEESQEHKTSVFWTYFQHWKQYFPMEEEKRREYLAWAEKIVHSRAEAIVGGQHRRHYGAVAVLLAMVAEIKESMGTQDARQEMFLKYKKKFPRHSSFQAEMRSFFGM